MNANDWFIMEYGEFHTNNGLINRVSIVDDDLVSNLLTSRTIKRSGFAKNVTAYDNAKEALQEIVQLAASNPSEFPELIFLDISMPSMDGLELLDEFDKLELPIPEKCKVFMLSSSINPNEIQKSRSHNKVVDFISKPLTVYKLETIFSQIGRA